MGLQISLRETNWPLGLINKFRRYLLVPQSYCKIPEECLELWVLKIIKKKIVFYRTDGQTHVQLKTIVRNLTKLRLKKIQKSLKESFKKINPKKNT
jgi:hypothetical protein